MRILHLQTDIPEVFEMARGIHGAGFQGEARERHMVPQGIAILVCYFSEEEAPAAQATALRRPRRTPTRCRALLMLMWIEIRLFRVALATSLIFYARS